MAPLLPMKLCVWYHSLDGGTVDNELVCCMNISLGGATVHVANKNACHNHNKILYILCLDCSLGGSIEVFKYQITQIYNSTFN